jgi:hypothetical protein
MGGPFHPGGNEMNKSTRIAFGCISASLLCLLAGDAYAGFQNCSGKPLPGASPALRRSMQKGCMPSRVLTLKCAQTAERRKLKTKEREQFMAECAGFRPEGNRKRR